jgi:hypothetical protein
MEFLKFTKIDLILIVTPHGRIDETLKNEFRAIQECLVDIADSKVALVINKVPS